jgi:hypothetical protein
VVQVTQHVVSLRVEDADGFGRRQERVEVRELRLVLGQRLSADTLVVIGDGFLDQVRAAQRHARLPRVVEGQGWCASRAEGHGRGAGSERGAE